VPSPPQSLSLTAASAECIRLAWQRPLHDNGAAIVGYEVSNLHVTMSV